MDPENNELEQNDGSEENESAPDELTLLKQRARLMGISFSNNIGIDALKAKIDAKTTPEPTVVDTLPTAPDAIPAGFVAPIPPTKNQAKKTEHQIMREQLVRENLKLVRVRVTNLDPKKKDLPGEIFSIANRYIGSVKKFVPYGADKQEEGYHIPYCIYEHLRSRKFLNLRSVKKNGKEFIEQTWAPEFSIEVLPQLTQEELDKLAAAQKAAGN